MPSNSARKQRLTSEQEREWDHWENRDLLHALYTKNVARPQSLERMEDALYDEIEGFYEAIRQTIAEGKDNPLTRKFREWSDEYVRREEVAQTFEDERSRNEALV